MNIANGEIGPASPGDGPGVDNIHTDIIQFGNNSPLHVSRARRAMPDPDKSPIRQYDAMCRRREASIASMKEQELTCHGHQTLTKTVEELKAEVVQLRSMMEPNIGVIASMNRKLDLQESRLDGHTQSLSLQTEAIDMTFRAVKVQQVELKTLKDERQDQAQFIKVLRENATLRDDAARLKEQVSALEEAKKEAEVVVLSSQRSLSISSGDGLDEYDHLFNHEYMEQHNIEFSGLEQILCPQGELQVSRVGSPDSLHSSLVDPKNQARGWWCVVM